MVESEREDLYEFVSGVYAFYRVATSAFALDVWWGATKPFDLCAVKEAFNRHLVNADGGQYLPKPADIAKLIGGGAADAALMAWAKVERAVRLVGPYQSVVFDDAIIHRVVSDMGGWCYFAMVKDDEWPFLRNQFATLYRGYRGRLGNAVYPAQLCGLIEQHNSSGGFRVDPPVLLGNQELCKLVLEGGSDQPMLLVGVQGNDRKRIEARP